MNHPNDLSFEIEFYEGILKKDPQYEEVIEMLGHLYTKVGRIEDGLAMDKMLVRLQPSKALNHYNLACSLSLMHQNQEALEALAKSISLGYRDINWLLEDEDLDSIRDEPEFEKLVAQLRSNV